MLPDRPATIVSTWLGLAGPGVLYSKAPALAWKADAQASRGAQGTRRSLRYKGLTSGWRVASYQSLATAPARTTPRILSGLQIPPTPSLRELGQGSEPQCRRGARVARRPWSRQEQTTYLGVSAVMILGWPVTATAPNVEPAGSSWKPAGATVRLCILRMRPGRLTRHLPPCATWRRRSMAMRALPTRAHAGLGLHALGGDRAVGRRAHQAYAARGATDERHA